MQTLVNYDKVKHGSYPHVCSCRKKCLLFNDAVLIVATLNTGFSRRAKSFEMILIGRFLEGIGAGRTSHYSMLLWLLWGGYRNLSAGSTRACTVTPVEQGADWENVRRSWLAARQQAAQTHCIVWFVPWAGTIEWWAVLCLQEVFLRRVSGGLAKHLT